MKNFIKAMDDLPLIVKIILALPAIDVVWSVYKLIKGIVNGSVLQIVVGILLLACGPVIVWILDIIWIVLKGKPFWFDTI